MTTQSAHDHNVVYVEYCRSCQTHSWCTHHDQAKYHDTFLKLSEMLSRRYPQLEIIGNMVPSHLIPFKIAENKYIDSNTNKYVVYPQIGSFEVHLNATPVFSKKETNSWPNLHAILTKIASIVDPDHSPNKIENKSKSPQKSREITPSKPLKNNEFLKSNDEKKTYYKDQAKGFTLTDHFKLYKPKQKQEEKDWLTEKQQSEGSLRQLSEFGRGESRQRSDHGDELKSVTSDFSGDSKIKEMLKNKGLMLKDHGKKEMIIKLDSIQQQNGNYDDYGATQRTAEKGPKKTQKIQELQNAFSNLENKFIRFESKVKDIQNKNDNFDYKKADSNQSVTRTNLRSTDQSKKEDPKRMNARQLPSFEKQGGAFVERPSKLEVYLNASQQEKNQKLHRIYGEWKVLKQTEKRNKRLLKNYGKNSRNEQSSDSQTSENPSVSPSSLANVITFKPKMQSNVQKQIVAVLKSNKGQKYSTIQKCQTPINNVSNEQPRFKTDDHFYNRRYFRKGKFDSEVEKESQETSTKLFKNTTNTMSLETIRGSAKQSVSKNASTNQLNSNLSQSAKQNINKINARISNIQAQLNKHKENQLLLKMGLEPQTYNPSQELRKSKSPSNASSQLSSKKFSYKNSIGGNLQRPSEVRDSHKGANPLKKGGHAALSKRGSKFSEVKRKHDTTKVKNQSEAIEEQSQIHDSNVVTQRSQELYRDEAEGRLGKNNKRAYEAKRNTNQKMSQRQPYRQEAVQQQQQEGASSQENDHIDTKRQKDSRIQHHGLHEPVVFLRKQKEWREAGASNSHRKPPKHISQHVEADNASPLKQAMQSNKFRFSQAKESPSKVSKSAKKNKKLGQQSKQLGSPTKKSTIHQEKDSLNAFQKVEKSTFGRIKKNKKKDQSLFRQNSNSSNNYSDAHEDYVEKENYDDTSNPDQLEEQNKRQLYSQPASGHIVRNNSKTLNFYKSADIVIQGESRVNLASQEAGRHPSATGSEAEAFNSAGQQESNEIEGKNHNNESDRSSDERVEGWETNSESGEQEIQASENEEDNQQDASQKPSSLSSNKRRNSLDKELDEIDNNDKVAEAPIPVQKAQATSEEGDKEIKPIEQKQHQEGKDDAVFIASPESAPQVQSVTPSVSKPNASPPKVAQATQPNKAIVNAPSEPQVDHELPAAQAGPTEKINTQLTKERKEKKPRQKKETKKRQKGREQTQVKQAKLVSHQPSDLEKIICGHYACYLRMKVANQCSKMGVPAPQSQHKQYEDVEFEVLVTYCPSIESIPEPEQKVPDTFTAFEPTPSAGQSNAQQSEDSSEHSECYSESEAQNSQKAELIQSVSAKEGEQDKEVPQQEIPRKDESRVAVGMISAPQAPASQASAAIPQNGNTIQSGHESKKVSSPIEPTPESIPRSQQQPVRQFQQNNVYCQPRKATEFKEIGIQKQATLEVSVQTDHPEGVFPVVLTRTSSIPTAEQDVRQESGRNIFELQQTKSDFNNTIRNNFVTESKKTAFDKRPKKQMERAHIIDKIYSHSIQLQAAKFASVISGNCQLAVVEEGSVRKLEEIYPSGELIGQKGLGIEHVTTKFTKLLKVVEILCEKSQWLVSRLFEDKHGILQGRAFGAWICHQYQWQCIVVDENILVDEQNQPAFSKHHGNQMWFNILEKVLAVALGGYQQLARTDSSVLFTMLTGCNAISARLKEDPSKNAKLLHLITDCLRKNYIIHANKNYDKSRTEEGRQAVYYVCSVRKSGEDETLIEVNQDGRQSFWIKLSKFVQEFNKIDILHLRINHNFAHLDLGVGRPGQLTVIELDFNEEGQGCVTLSYLAQAGSLKAYLYKEQKNKVLKLVGQAKQKVKSHLFFQCSFSEGRYFVFAQAEEKPTRIAFLGQGQPSLRITEEIHSQGLKNDLAEYLPVKDNEQSRFRQRGQLQSGNEGRERRGPRLKDNFMESRLRETFMDYVVGRSRRN